MDGLPDPEISMFQCHICGNKSAQNEFVSEVFLIEGRRVLVEHIPAEVCERCGEATFASDTAELVRRLIRGGAHPTKTETMDVFALS
jgi:YgiT-type zinc finger domain-containing protein